MDVDESGNPEDQIGLKNVARARNHRRRPCWTSPVAQTWLGVTLVLLVAVGLFGGTKRGRTNFYNVRTRVNAYLRQYRPTTLTYDNTDYSQSSSTDQAPLKHLLIPASHPSQHLCKTLLTASALGYPQPHLLAFNQTFNDKGMTDGGAHIAKIHNTIDYISHLSDAQDEELVLIVDGYDTWFQLPPEVLVSRYYDVLEAADTRFERYFGRKAMRQVERLDIADLLTSRVVFGAQKHCSPNQLHTMACYAVPDSPLPSNLYGGNTDTSIGWTEHSSYRARYLNAGYIMGPVCEMRRLFQRADDTITGWHKLWDAIHIPETDPGKDDGSGSSARFYHGSDQSIFAKIFARQEHVREIIRRRFDRSAGGSHDSYSSTRIDGAYIPDRLTPPWFHEEWQDDKYWMNMKSTLGLSDHLELQLVQHVKAWEHPTANLLDRYDFGITLDYFSDLGHQTEDSDRDADWLQHDQPVEAQMGSRHAGPFDCPNPLISSEAKIPPGQKAEASPAFPADIANSRHPSQTKEIHRAEPTSVARNPWLSTPLYTNICLSNEGTARIPVMVHHSGDKSRRNSDWHKMEWLYDLAKPMLNAVNADNYADMGVNDHGEDRGGMLGFVNSGRGSPTTGGAWTDTGFSLSWDSVCPKSLVKEGKLFG